MIVRPLSEHVLPSVEQERAGALRSAKLLRDCSLRKASTREEQRACRTLMREQAIRWKTVQS
jgi:hypothetical protein